MAKWVFGLSFAVCGTCKVGFLGGLKETVPKNVLLSLSVRNEAAARERTKDAAALLVFFVSYGWSVHLHSKVEMYFSND